MSLQGGTPWQTCTALARSAWTRIRALAHPTLEHAAHTVGRDRQVVRRWESPQADHPVPLAVLWHRDLLPDEAFEELLDQARRDRATQPSREELATPEGALGAGCHRAAEVLGPAAVALSDGRLTPGERTSLRPGVQEAIRALHRVLRAWDRADRQEAAQGAVGRGLRAVPGTGGGVP